MMEAYQNYISLLGELAGTLEALSQVERNKTQAVRKDDLAGLNECIKQEQTASLQLRGLDKKREEALDTLGLRQIPLSQLPQHYPEPLRLEAKKTVEHLQQQYQLFRSAAQVARSTLECNLHEIEKILAQEGGAALDGPGYQGSDPQLPKPLRTDFRA